MFLQALMSIITPCAQRIVINILELEAKVIIIEITITSVATIPIKSKTLALTGVSLLYRSK